MNYKVKVNNETESREVESYLDLLLGGANICKEYDVYDKYPRFVFGNKEFINTWTMVNWNKIDNKEITIQQLRDLVVLKRNDKSDRNVIDPEEDANLYLDSDNKLFVFHLPTQKWKESNLNGEEEVMERLKPITKPLKEYLVPQGNGKYTLTKAPEKRVSDWVEVPESTELVIQEKDGNLRYFKNGCGHEYCKGQWCSVSIPFAVLEESKLIWLKDGCQAFLDPEYSAMLPKPFDFVFKKPEELPLVDDDPNASALVCHQSIETATGYQLDVIGQNIYGSRSRNYSESDVDYRAYLVKFVADNKRKSLNTPMAEIERVKQDALSIQVGGEEINNPAHYTNGGIECIDAIESSMSHDAFCGFLKGNIQKYLWRYQYKGGLSSLHKAKWYINKLIEKEQCKSEKISDN